MSTPPAAGGANGAGGRLACGADSDALLDQVAEGRGSERTAHQGACPHCQATLAEYARLWSPFDRLAAQDVHAPPAVLDRALTVIRHSSGPAGWGRVEDRGESFLVATRAVVSVAGHAARTSAGVRMALSDLGELRRFAGSTTTDTTGEAGNLTAGVSGQSVALELTVAAEYGHDLYRLAEHLRERVAAEVRAQIGLAVVEVDVTITDVFARSVLPAGGQDAESSEPSPPTISRTRQERHE